MSESPTTATPTSHTLDRGLRRWLWGAWAGMAILLLVSAALDIQHQVEQRFQTYHQLVQSNLTTLFSPLRSGGREALEHWIRAQSRMDFALSLDTPLETGGLWISRSYPLRDDQGRNVGQLHLATDLTPLLRHHLPLLLLLFLLWAGLHSLAGRPLFASLRRYEERIRALQDQIEEISRERNQLQIHSLQSRTAFKHLAYFDLLTDLPSRLKLLEELDQRLADQDPETAQPAALISLDLRNFKEINESLGHKMGDRILVEVAKRLRKNLKKNDLIARPGGDEFVIFLADLPQRETALEVSRRILQVLEDPLDIGGIQFDIEAAIGIAFYPEHSTDGQELVRLSDTAMYRAKMHGGGIEIYDPSDESEFTERLNLKTELRRAIEEGELQVYFQPKINLSSGHIQGVECLVRWTHPERGFIGPDQFVPLAESSNLIHPMTGLVFNVALYQCRKWLDQGMEMGVAVNCSAQSLADEHLPKRLKALLYTWDVPARLLTLEVTESAIMSHPEQSLQVLDRLHGLGIQISVDDFGTGYSSLSYLKSMPVSELKIDRSFVSDMLIDENDAVIIRATIDMAHDLGLKVTAEGIEDEATWNALVELGCDLAQGFYMGRPQTARDLTQWLRESPFGWPESAQVQQSA